MSRATLAIFVVFALAGCESPGAPAYGFPDRPPQAVEQDLPRVTPLAATPRPLAIGVMDDLTIQPVGAHYTEGSVVDRVAPGAGLRQTYFYWATTDTLRPAVRAGLQQHGVRAFLDDADVGVAAPYGGTAYPSGVLVLRGELLAFSYSRHQGQDQAQATVAWTLLDGDSGRVIAQARHQAAAVTPPAEGPGQGTDPFAALGERLATQLVGDPIIRTALTSGPTWSGAPGSVEAGTPRPEEGR